MFALGNTGPYHGNLYTTTIGGIDLRTPEFNSSSAKHLSILKGVQVDRSPLPERAIRPYTSRLGRKQGYMKGLIARPGPGSSESSAGSTVMTSPIAPLSTTLLSFLLN